MLSIRSLNKTYANGVQALKDVNLEIPTGLYGLLGPNGAGKSSLMRTIATLQEPDSGSIQFGALDVLRDTAVHLSDGSSGTARGVDASGALRVQTATGIQTISSGEVSVRPLHMALPH